jgi:hypothetical protein
MVRYRTQNKDCHERLAVPRTYTSTFHVFSSAFKVDLHFAVVMSSTCVITPGIDLMGAKSKPIMILCRGIYF